MGLIPVTEQSAIDGHPANFTYRAVNSYFYNWANPEQLARVDVVRHRVAQLQGRLPGFVYRSRIRMIVTNDSLLAYRFQNRIAESVHLPAADVAGRRSHRTRHPCMSKIRGRATG